MVEIAVGDLVGESDQFGERHQHAFAHGDQNQQQRQKELATKDQIGETSVAFRSALAQPIIDLDFDAADPAVVANQRLTCCVGVAEPPFGIFGEQQLHAFGVVDGNADDLLVLHYRIDNGAHAVEIEVPHRAVQAIGQQGNLVLSKGGKLRALLFLPHCRDQQPTAQHRKQQTGTQRDDNARIQAGRRSTCHDVL